MGDSKLVSIVNTATVVGRQLLRLSTICVIGSLVAFGVAVVADRLQEWSDYADDEDECSLFD